MPVEALFFRRLDRLLAGAERRHFATKFSERRVASLECAASG